jgi:hypothetical protein
MILDELNKKIADIESLANDKSSTIESKVSDLTDGLLMVADAVDIIPEMVDEKITAITKDLSTIRDSVSKVKAQKGSNGRDGIDGLDGLNGKDGKDGSPDKPKDIADKLNTLENVIDPKVIKGSGEYVNRTDLNKTISTLENQTRFLIQSNQNNSNSNSFTGVTVDGTTVTGDGLNTPLSANFSQTGKYMISGGAVWSGTGLTYDVSIISYFFNGVKSGSQASITLDPSDPTFNRLDSIVIDEAGTISVITGVPSASPATPPIPEDQLQVQFILVEAGSTVPTITSENIYLDDPTTNWTFSTYTTGTATGSINFAGTSSPKQGVNDIEASADARLGARFVRGTSFDAFQYTMLQVWVRFTGTAVATNKSLNVRFENSAGTLVANTVNLFSYGLQRGVLNTWQLVVVPITAFGALPTTVKGLKVIMAGGTVGVVRQWDIDYMILTNGSVPYANVPTIAFYKDDVGIASQSGLNLIEGTGVTIDAVNNPLYNRVDYTINSSGGGSPAGSSSWIQYNNAGAFGADDFFTRDPSTLDTNILRTYTNGGGAVVDTGFKTLQDIGTGFPGTAITWGDDLGNIVNIGVLDGEGFGIDTGVLFLQANDAVGNENGISMYSQGGQWIIEDTNTGILSAIGGAASQFGMSYADDGSGINYQFQVSASGPRWWANGNRYKLPVTMPDNVGDVMVVSAIPAPDRVELAWAAPSGGGVELGGTTSLFTDTMIQFIDAGGVQGGSSLFTWDDNLARFMASTDYASNVKTPSFSGSGLNDLTSLGAPYTGSTNAEFKVQIDGFQDVITFDALTGGSFGVGNTVTGSVSGAVGQIEAGVETTQATVLILNGIHFAPGDVIDNGFGVTADYQSLISSADTFEWFFNGISQATFVVVDGSQQILSNGITAGFAATTGHTYGDFWTIQAVQLQQTELTNNKNFFQLPGLSDNFESYVNGATQVYSPQGVQSFNGLWQSEDNRGYIALPMMFFSQSTTGRSGHSGFIDDTTFETRIGLSGIGGFSRVTDINFGAGFDAVDFININSVTAEFGDTGNSYNAGKLVFDYDSGFSTYLGAEDQTVYLRIIPGSSEAELFANSNLTIASGNDLFMKLTGGDNIFIGQGDQVKVGWSDFGIWQLFDKDSMIMTFGDINNDVGGYQFAFDVMNGVFTTSGLLNNLAGATATPSLESSVGGGHAMAAGYAGLFYDPASVEATATIVLPSTPVNGQETTIYFGGTITTGNPVVTALTVDPGTNSIVGNVPPGADAGVVLKFKYRTANTTWYRDN